MSCGDSLFPVQAHDYTGAVIRWDREGYDEHVQKRPATAEWHEAIGRTLIDPELVVELRDGGRGYYRRQVLPAKYGNLYLYVVVRWSGALGDIATAFPSHDVEKFARIVLMKK